MKVKSLRDFGPKKKNPIADPEGVSFLANTIAGMVCDCFPAKACKDTIVVPKDTVIACIKFDGIVYPVPAPVKGGTATASDILSDIIMTAVMYSEGTPHHSVEISVDETSGDTTICHIGSCALECVIDDKGVEIEASRCCEIVTCLLYQNVIAPNTVGEITIGDVTYAFDTTGLEVDQATADLLTADLAEALVDSKCPAPIVKCGSGVFVFCIFVEPMVVPQIVNPADAKSDPIDFVYCKVDCEEAFNCAEANATPIKSKKGGKSPTDKLSAIRTAAAKVEADNQEGE